MKDQKIKNKSVMIVCNILLTLLLLITTAVSVTLAIKKFDMNIGGNISFQATDVQATISQGILTNGTVAGENKMQEIVLSPTTDGTTEKATWQNLEITFDGLEDVTISFSVTNNHTESNLKMALETSYTQMNNMTMQAKIDGNVKTNTIISANDGSSDNSVDCQIVFHIEDPTKSASIQGFSLNYTFENTDEEAPAIYSVSIDPSASGIVSAVSKDSATNGEQIIVTANGQDSVTEDYVTLFSGLYYIENGSEEHITINQIDGQYSFTMPESNITIYADGGTYRRLDDFEFEGNSLTGYTGSDKDIVIPSYYDTVTVNSMNYLVEKEGTDIITIGQDAFRNYTSDGYIDGAPLVSVTFSEDSKVETIDDRAFACQANLKTLELPSTLKRIGVQAFESCKKLQFVDISSDIEQIDNAAFRSCASMQSINISSIENIDFGFWVFNGCTNLKGSSDGYGRYLGDTQNPYYLLIGVNADEESITSFTINSNCHIIYDKALYNLTNLQTITIPSSVKIIGKEAFSTCSKLSSVNFAPNSHLEFMDYRAFVSCDNLQSIIIPKSVKNITTAFSTEYIDFESQLTNLYGRGSSVVLPDDNIISYLQEITFESNSQLETIVDYAFYGCHDLKSITIPASVVSIGDYAFSVNEYTANMGPEGYYEAGLKEIKFEEGSKLQTIGAYAFKNCDELAKITIPKDVVSIGEEAFVNNGVVLRDLTIESETLIANADESYFDFGGLFYVVYTLRIPEELQGVLNNTIKNNYEYKNSENGYAVYASKY